MKKLILIILILLTSCAYSNKQKCPSKTIQYPQKCIIYVKTDDTPDIKVLDMIKDMCGIKEKNKCYTIDILNDKEYMGWSFICF